MREKERTEAIISDLCSASIVRLKAGPIGCRILQRGGGVERQLQYSPMGDPRLPAPLGPLPPVNKLSGLGGEEKLCSSCSHPPTQPTTTIRWTRQNSSLNTHHLKDAIKSMIWRERPASIPREAAPPLIKGAPSQEMFKSRGNIGSIDRTLEELMLQVIG
jgi:hypothetical protein